MSGLSVRRHSLPIRPWNGEDRLSDRTLEAEVTRLRMARPRKEFLRVVDRMTRHFSSSTLVGAKPFREAWTVAEFSNFVHPTPTRIQLADDNADDDFYIERDGEWQAFEATEAVLPPEHAKARARELGEAPRVLHEDNAEIIRQSALAVPTLIERLAAKALSTRGGRLVVYWNTGWLAGVGKVLAALRAESEPYREQFAEAWVIGHRGLISLAPEFKVVRIPVGFT